MPANPIGFNCPRAPVETFNSNHVETQVAVGDGVTSQFKFSLPKVPITPNSLSVTSNGFVFFDDGKGNLKGMGLKNGGVNYKTGVVQMTFVYPPIKGNPLGAIYDVALVTVKRITYTDVGEMTPKEAEAVVEAWRSEYEENVPLF
jgi:hypothetical protein